MSTEFFIFDHRDFQYAVNVMDVVEIVEIDSIVPFHGTFHGCHGYVAHRNLLIPILDTTAVTTDTLIAGDPTLVVILNDHGVTFALAMDQFISVHAFDDSEGDGDGKNGVVQGTVDGPFVKHTKGFRDKTLVILDVPEIAKSVQTQIGDQRITSENSQADGESQPFETGEVARRIYMCARIDQCTFAIDVANVIELIEEVDVTPLFKVTPSLRGLINLRGQVLACVDISTQLGYPPRVLGEQSQFIVLHCDDADLALCVDEVTGIRHLPASGFQESNVALSDDMSRYLTGILEEDQQRTFLLAVRGVFDSPNLEPYRNVKG